MAAKMTPRERLMTALRGEMPDQVPFACYEEILPSGTAGARLHRLGLAVLARIYPFRVRRDRVTIRTHEIPGESYPAYLTEYETPIGTLTQKQVIEPGYGSLWTKEYLIKRPEDYALFEFVLRDEIYEPDIDGFLQRDRSFGELGLAIPRAADPPSQFLWRRFTGLDRFALDWYDCRDEVTRVLDALRDCSEKIWRIVRDTPSEICCSGGNISGDMVGPPMFQELILPHFEREAAIMHPVGKKIMNHMDGTLRALIPSIAGCPVDIVEAFTPLPDGNVSVAEARAAWPEKTLSTNFPSSVHIRSTEAIRGMTIELLRDAAPGGAFVVGITEDVPANVRDDSLAAIAETLNRFGRCPIRPKALPRNV